MPAQFSIAVEPARHLLTLSCAGFYLIEDIAALHAAYLDACDQLHAGPLGHLTLVDASGMRIQTREAVAAFTAIVRQPRLRSRRLAFVVNHSLARQQILRLPEPGRPNVAFFDDRTTAEAWLFEDALSGARTVARYRHAPASPMSAGHGCIAPNAA